MCRRVTDTVRFVTTQGPPSEPEPFRTAVESMTSAAVRPEIKLGPIRPPQRLAPFSYALGAEIKHSASEPVGEYSDGDAFGRLILLYDPQGDEAWQGTLRLVAYIQADVDAALAEDSLLPEVAWSWLHDALEGRTAEYVALGGTITATTSVRFGEIAGPPKAHQLEMRASWTSQTLMIKPQVEAFCEVLEYAAGLPPVGITSISNRFPTA
nr:DUF3000 domain-containing protein [Lolliginicoccus lacisalsi]